MSYNLFDYNVKIIYDEKDNDYIAAIDEMKGISAFADTPQEALDGLQKVFDALVQISEEDGDPLPEPAKLRNYSGKFVVRVPKSLHKTLIEKAREEGVSLNQEVVYCITESLSGYNPRQRKMA